MAGPAIEVHDLVVRYHGTVAVDRISFEAQAGQILALLGPNGAGKTSTIEILEGYRRPTVGKVRVLGLDPQRDHRALTKRIGVMLQRGGVYPTMTPLEAVRLFARYYDQSDEPEGLLFRVGLTDVATTPWRRLSGGEQQRLSLALALVGRPWVAFLDEPTAGVDPQGRLTIREVIGDLRAAGTCVLLTTHELDEAERLADRVVILDHGRVVADGTPSELMNSSRGNEIRFGAPHGLDTVALGAALSVEVVEERPGEYLVRAQPLPATIAAVTAWLAERDLPLSDLRAGRQRLEDVFLRLTGSTAASDSGAGGRRGTGAAAGGAAAPAGPGAGPGAGGAGAAGMAGAGDEAVDGRAGAEPARDAGGRAGADNGGGGDGAGRREGGGRRRHVAATGLGPGATQMAPPATPATAPDDLSGEQA
ncbi:MAG TPA: ABC transporter ATP-binding protein [Acidimicrobiales bacterium]|nr:ABC transporter ATP-binding protein [Acidimicrobiales bacterium]